MSTSDKLLSILDLFDVERPDWSVEEAATALGLATSTAYRYFASLAAAGLIAPFATARYVLGPTIIRYDRQLRLTDPLISAAQPEMRRLARIRPGESVVFLCRLLGGQVMCVHQAAVGAPSFAVGYERGRLMPLFAGSASKVILANLSSRQLRVLYERQADDFAAAGLGTSLEESRRALRAIRTAGSLKTEGEIDPGMRGLSVPILESGGAILASLSIASPASAVGEDEAAALRTQLLLAGRRIQAEIVTIGARKQPPA